MTTVLEAESFSLSFFNDLGESGGPYTDVTGGLLFRSLVGSICLIAPLA